MKRFVDRTVLVTGAASGIGRGIAERFLAEGARVAAFDVQGEALERLTADLAVDRAQLLAVPCDVTEVTAVRDAVAKVARWSGGIDVLVNAAGIGRARRFEELEEEEWERTLRVNLFGPFFVTKYALPHLLGRAGANIVNIASIAALRGQAYHSAYCASKAGLLNFTRSLALEFATRGLRANCICPGGVKTPLVQNFVPDGSMESHLIAYAMPPIPGKWGKPADIAAAVAFLASEEARMINGAALVVDFGVLA